MYHIIYKTTNILNNRYYIGLHSTNRLDDGYFGSGSILCKAIKKYGKSNFVREVLYYCNNREELIEKEKEIVTQQLIDSDHKCYNRYPGGSGVGFGDKNPFYGKKHSESLKRRFSEELILSGSRRGVNNSFFGKKHSEEYKRKSSDRQIGITGTPGLYASMLKQTKGWWITPNACFMSSRDAAKHLGISESSIKKRCGSDNIKIVIKNYQTPEELVGKTWKEHGFGYISYTEINLKRNSESLLT